MFGRDLAYPEDFPSTRISLGRRAGAKLPLIRQGDCPKENAPKEGATDSLRISVCADGHLWKFDSILSAEEWFFDSKALKAELKDKDMDRYLRVRDKATLLVHLAKVRTAMY